MNKNDIDKILLLMVALILLITIFVGVYVVTHIVGMAHEMGIMAEKIGTLEELVPLRSIER